VLLTRSRLCPRPKPGSSLHLHVLSTPPAFVLSQDQTLREELLTESCRASLEGAAVHEAAPDAIDEVCSGAVQRQEAPSAFTNLDASIKGPGARPGPIGAHAVEFSKTAAPLLWRGFLHEDALGTLPSGQWIVARGESRVQARRGAPHGGAPL
jgi:hypothetical protein